MTLIKASVAVRIHKHPDAAEVFRRLFRVVIHFSDKQPTVGVEGHCHRICQQWFCGSLLHLKAIDHLK